MHYSVGDFVVYTIAALVLSLATILIAYVARNFRSYLSGVVSYIVNWIVGWAVIGAVLFLIVGAIGGGMWGWNYLQDQALMQRCMTAYERQARALPRRMIILADNYAKGQQKRLRNAPNLQLRKKLRLHRKLQHVLAI